MQVLNIVTFNNYYCKGGKTMHVSLPYEIGTILKTVESNKIQYDKVHHYIVVTKIQVVLELCYDTSQRLSVPIDIERLKKKWTVCDSNCNYDA
jgi:hypothetical protein